MGHCFVWWTCSVWRFLAVRHPESHPQGREPPCPLWRSSLRPSQRLHRHLHGHRQHLHQDCNDLLVVATGGSKFICQKLLWTLHGIRKATFHVKVSNEESSSQFIFIGKRLGAIYALKVMIPVNGNCI